jgi:hypothetical protein
LDFWQCTRKCLGRGGMPPGPFSCCFMFHVFFFDGNKLLAPGSLPYHELKSCILLLPLPHTREFAFLCILMQRCLSFHYFVCQSLLVSVSYNNKIFMFHYEFLLLFFFLFIISASLLFFVIILLIPRIFGVDLHFYLSDRFFCF